MIFNGRVTIRLLTPGFLGELVEFVLCPACGSTNVERFGGVGFCHGCEASFSIRGISDHSSSCDHCAVHMSFTGWTDSSRPQHCEGCVDGSRLVPIGER